MAGVSHVLVRNPVNMCMCNYTSDYSFDVRAGIVYLVEFTCLFQIGPFTQYIAFRNISWTQGICILKYTKYPWLCWRRTAERHKQKDINPAKNSITSPSSISQAHLLPAHHFQNKWFYTLFNLWSVQFRRACISQYAIRRVNICIHFAG